MCRSIKTLFNLDPPAAEEEIREASLQFVRKLSGFTKPSNVNQAAFDAAIKDVAVATGILLKTLTTTAQPRDRALLAEQAKARASKRFGPA